MLRYLAIILFVVPLAVAQDGAGAGAGVGPVVIDDNSAPFIARERARSVQAARAGEAAVSGDTRQALAPFLPQVSGSLNYQRNGSSSAVFLPVQPATAFNQGVTIPASPLNGYSGAIRVDQALYTFGRLRATLRANKASEASAVAETAVAGRDAALRALVALQQVRFAAASVSVAEARVAQREDELTSAKNRLEAGNVSALDVNQAEINLVQSRDILLQAQSSREVARIELGTALDLPVARLEIDEDLRRPDQLPELLQAAEAAIDGSVELEAISYAADALRARADEARASGRPQLGAFAEYNGSGSRLNDLNDDWRVGLGLTWTLYDGGGRYGRRNANLSRAQQLERQSDQLIQERQRQLDAIRTELSILDSRIQAQAAIVDLAADNYALAQEQYRLGTITLTRLGEVGLAEVEARFNLVAAISEEALLAHQLRALAE